MTPVTTSTSQLSTARGRGPAAVPVRSMGPSEQPSSPEPVRESVRASADETCSPMILIRETAHKILQRRGDTLVRNANVDEQGFTVKAVDGSRTFDNTLVSIYGDEFVGAAYNQRLSAASLRECKDLRGKSLNEIVGRSEFLSLLACDAALSLEPPRPSDHREIIPRSGMEEKAARFIDFVTRTFASIRNRRILLVGADINMARAIYGLGVEELVIVDLAENRVGVRLQLGPEARDWVTVHPGADHLQPLLSLGRHGHFDAAIVTGMTFSTGTAENLILEAHQQALPLVLYMVSCSHFAPLLVDHRLVSMALAIRLPPVDQAGETIIDIFGQFPG